MAHYVAAMLCNLRVSCWRGWGVGWNGRKHIQMLFSNPCTSQAPPHKALQPDSSL